MKKQFLTLCIILSFSHYSNAQNPNGNGNTQWKINGNNASTTDFMGTTNNQSLVFKTNNIQRAEFDTQGRLVIDGGGEVIIHPGGLNRPILSNPIAAYMLKIGGSAHIDGEVNTRQLFVQEYITYLKSLKGPSMNVDTIRMDSTRGIFGNTKIFGDVQIKQNLEVLGEAKFKGNVIAENGFTFNGFNGLHYTPATAISGEVFQLGNKIAKVTTVFCSTPSTYHPLNTFQYDGGYISRVAAGTGTGATDASLTFAVAPWNGNGMIELSGVSSSGLEDNGLSINEFCKRNTYINIGWDLNTTPVVNGGRVVMGAEVEMQRSLKIGYNGIPSVIDPTTCIEINQSTPNTNGVKVKTWETTIKAFAIEYADGKNPFVVYGSGVTHIGVGRPKVGGIAANAMLSGDGLILAKEVRVAVSTTTHWADYVFEKNYKLKSLTEVEKYILKHKHLPDVPSAEEVKENGIDMLEISAILLKKIEELTLYTIELEKKLDTQQKDINALKK